jgi:hypothetical protein|tara:strand:+ start:84 stop:299 length:216 start_codon:yes stop_codon:yes gene_type:complete
MLKEKAIKICKNLTKTISKMSDKLKYESQSSVYKNVTAKKRDLQKIKSNLIKKHKITSKEIEKYKVKIKYL